MNNMRSLLGRHFGEENVFWTIDDGPEPTDADLRRRTDELLRNEAIRRYVALIIERAQVQRVMDFAQNGGDTGMSDQELALLPDLIEVLSRKIVIERDRALWS